MCGSGKKWFVAISYDNAKDHRRLKFSVADLIDFVEMVNDRIAGIPPEIHSLDEHNRFQAFKGEADGKPNH